MVCNYMQFKQEQPIQLYDAADVLPHIFITGYAGHGKDSIGDHLVEFYGYERLSFSDGIRDEIACTYTRAPEPVTPDWQNAREIKNIDQDRLALIYCDDQAFINVALTAFEKEDQTFFDDANVPQNEQTLAHRLKMPRSPRRIQQIWGTEYRRTQDDEYWLKKAESETDFSHPQVLTSVRHENELDFGSRVGAKRVHVIRPQYQEACDHVTERLLPITEDTIIIMNDGKISDLKEKIDSIMVQFATQAANNPPISRQNRACP